MAAVISLASRSIGDQRLHRVVCRLRTRFQLPVSDDTARRCASVRWHLAESRAVPENEPARREQALLRLSIVAVAVDHRQSFALLGQLDSEADRVRVDLKSLGLKPTTRTAGALKHARIGQTDTPLLRRHTCLKLGRGPI